MIITIQHSSRPWEYLTFEMDPRHKSETICLNVWDSKHVDEHFGYEHLSQSQPCYEFSKKELHYFLAGMAAALKEE